MWDWVKVKRGILAGQAYLILRRSVKVNLEQGTGAKITILER